MSRLFRLLRRDLPHDWCRFHGLSELLINFDRVEFDQTIMTSKMIF